ncbi:MAG: C1 family peptidase [Planctomycetes bacterium]|nr:C1 family peptidase [Planctomycetota bacterium]
MPTKKNKRTFDARPDHADFRDRLYQVSLVNVPATIPLAEYRNAKVPILDQGEEGACTGFGLATVAHYLLRTRRGGGVAARVSPRMFYQMAKRYDEWPGTSYEGSSARGAVKGWHKHGVCSERLWPNSGVANRLTNEREADAARVPLGAYYRVNTKDLAHMHAAMTEVGVLYATSMVHAGWDRVGKDGIIPFSKEVDGGHAYALVAYDEHGFWLQNSWGRSWGKQGFARISYADWLQNGSDVWVCRLGVPVVMD